MWEEHTYSTDLSQVRPIPAVYLRKPIEWCCLQITAITPGLRQERIAGECAAWTNSQQDTRQYPPTQRTNVCVKVSEQSTAQSLIKYAIYTLPGFFNVHQIVPCTPFSPLFQYCCSAGQQEVKWGPKCMTTCRSGGEQSSCPAGDTGRICPTSFNTLGMGEPTLRTTAKV